MFIIIYTSFAARRYKEFCEYCGEWALICEDCTGTKETTTGSYDCYTDPLCKYATTIYYTSYSCTCNGKIKCYNNRWSSHNHYEDHTRCSDRYVCTY